MSNFDAADLRITEGFIAESRGRVNRLSAVESPTTNDLINLERARYDLAEYENQLERMKAEMTKPGPPKQYPVRVDLRISHLEQDAISRISQNTGEDRSEIIRRLILEADPGEGQ